MESGITWVRSLARSPQIDRAWVELNMIPSRLNVNFLSVEQKRLDRAFILGAHRRGQQVYAWTVNTAEDMERLLDLGIDGVITDQFALARKILDQYLSRSKTERAARRVWAWLAD